MSKQSLTLWLSLVLIAAGATAQTIPLEVEAGYRWLDLNGSSDMYRTQINERSGFLIRSLTYSTTDFGGNTNFADHFRLDASDLGVGPAGSLRVDMGKSNLYRFTLGYRQTSAFSALPAFTNPFIGQGIIPGQHTYDRDRRVLDADFEFLKWSSKITPFVGISWNRYSGPGTTTYHVGQDEFLLDSNLSNRDQEVRAGFGFNYGSFYGQLTQGWRNFRDHETLTLAPGAGAGNNLAPILGTPITASSLTRTSRADGHTPFTNAYVTGQFSRVRLIGNYVRSASNLNGSETEDAAGSFASFGLGRFFTGFNDLIDSRSKNTTWRGGARAEVAIVNDVDFLAGFQREHRSLEGSALINSLFLQSIPFGGANPSDVRTVLNAASALDRDEDVLSAAVSARSLGPFAVRAGASQSRQDVTVSPDLSEIVVPGSSQGGTFSRRVNTIDASGSFARKGFTAGASWWHDKANDPILRTDFLDRDRYRLRGGWADPTNLFRVGVTAEESRPKNDRAGFAYSANVRQYTADAEIVPNETIHVRASASRFRATSSILFRHPENFTTDTSKNRENGDSLEGGVLFVFAPASVDTSFLRFDNSSGTNPFTIDRFRIRAMFKVVGSTGLTAEWNRDRYSEPLPSYGNFQADRYGLYLRWTR